MDAMSSQPSSAPSALEEAKRLGPTIILIALTMGFSQVARGAAFRVLLALSTVALLSRTWVQVATYYVPDPYLDEVFHIPQAQKFCEGRFSEWDDKITTPPGLYLFSLISPKTLMGSNLGKTLDCTTLDLRGVNALCLVVLTILALLCRQEIENRLSEGRGAPAKKKLSPYAIHSALNIALCPVIFFFSGLYYTDVASTTVVLAAFWNSLVRMGRDVSSLKSDLNTVAIGITAFFMRQTNVFWVVVFLGLLEAVHAVKTLRPGKEKIAEPTSLVDRLTQFAEKSSAGHVHDPALSGSWPDDMLFTAISLLIAGICNPLRIFRQIWPHIMVLFIFVAFIIWNGGVVLGDKSNHVATIHLAQMLYIWPFFAFFSLPLLIQFVVAFISRASRLSGPAETAKQKKGSAKSDKPSNSGFVVKLFDSKLYLPLYAVATIGVAAAIVKFNTIIHPFTLADNRHYMFYVFRYTIRRAAWIRFALVIPYVLSQWLVWGTLSGSSTWLASSAHTVDSTNPGSRIPFLNHPFTNDSSLKQSKEPEATKKKDEGRALAQNPLLASTNTVSTSTAIIFLLATALSLITAPLVEPRYFIIPWVVWRLVVPAWRVQEDLPSSWLSPWGRAGPLRTLLACFQQYDPRLILETGWFLVVNAATMYIFLFKPYQWRAEDGTLLDEGRWQRFMW